MNFTESIRKARERGLPDDKILELIVKQNPHKEEFFKQEKEKGLSSTDILNNITKEENEEKPEETQKEEIIPKEQPPLKKDSRLPQKPTDEAKLWRRIFITLILISLVALSFTLLYHAFFVPRLRPISPQKIVHEIQTPKPTPPVVKIYPERDTIKRFPITVDDEYLLYLRKIAREEKGGELVRIIAEDHREGVREPRITNLEDFFNVFEIDYPSNFFEKINKEFNLFIYTREMTGRIAFAVEFDRSVRDDVEWTIMRPWENTMPEDFQQFFDFWNTQITSGDFSNTTHKGEMPVSFPLRYREGTGGVGIYYSITEDRLLFATSLDSIRVLIERYYYFD
jgi:hypothetical protein